LGSRGKLCLKAQQAQESSATTGRFKITLIFVAAAFPEMRSR
jgi:hypothetical protein